MSRLQRKLLFALVMVFLLSILFYITTLQNFKRYWTIIGLSKNNIYTENFEIQIIKNKSDVSENIRKLTIFDEEAVSRKQNDTLTHKLNDVYRKFDLVNKKLRDLEQGRLLQNTPATFTINKEHNKLHYNIAPNDETEWSSVVIQKTIKDAVKRKDLNTLDKQVSNSKLVFVKSENRKRTNNQLLGNVNNNVVKIKPEESNVYQNQNPNVDIINQENIKHGEGNMYQNKNSDVDINQGEIKLRKEKEYQKKNSLEEYMDQERKPRERNLRQNVRKNTNILPEQKPTIRPDTCQGCFKNNFNYLINSPSYCDRYQILQVLILIFTAPNNFLERDTARKTWGSLCRTENYIGCVFVLGVVKDTEVMNHIHKEAQVYQDIVQLDFKESYANLTYKTMSGFRWAKEFCAHTQYVMKTDGDMYINTELLPIMLRAAPRSQFFGGNCWGSVAPHRNTSSKWFVSYKQYPHSNFPPVCSGTGYILSADVVWNILRMSANIPFFHLEDVYVAIAIEKLKVTPRNLKGFSNMKQKYSPCFYRNEVITSHYLAPEMLINYWTGSRNCALQKHYPQRLFVVLSL